MPEPVGFRSRYRSEPEMIGHYPWTWASAERRRRKFDRPECEYEDLFNADQVREAIQAATEWAAKRVPMQPVVLASDEVIRFKENRIVYALLENSRRHGYGLNEATRDDYTPDERMQMAQLIGYSVSGYGSLSYVTDESYEEAERRAAAIRARDGGGQG